MFNLIVVIAIAISCVSAKPLVASVVAAPAVVTATSSQFIARNYNGLAAPVVAAAYTAPVAAAYTAPVAAAYTSPVAAAYTAPFAYSSPYAAYTAYAPSYAAAYSAPLIVA